MTAINASLGEVRGFGAFVLWAEGQSDANRSSLAARWGRNESSLRGWVNKGVSPPIDEVLFSLKPRMTERERLTLDQRFVGADGIITPAGTFDLSGIPTARAVMAEAVRSLHELSAFIGQVQQRCAGERINEEDAIVFANSAVTVNQVLARAVLIAQRCAGMNGGRRRDNPS